MNLACIGTGKIVEAFLLECTKNKEIRIYGVYSRTIEKGNVLAHKFFIKNVFTCINEMLLDERIDIIYIASPNSLHFEQASLCIKAGKHVILEKPFCTNIKETLDLFRLAEKHNVYIFEALTVRFMPNLDILKKRIIEIGEIRSIEASCVSYSSRYNDLINGSEPNVFSKKYSGGSLMDLNIYNIVLVLELFGMPENFKYSYLAHSNGIDLSGSVVLNYPNKIALCFASKISYGKRFVIISGDNGYIEIPDGSNGLKEFRIVKNDQTQVINIQEKNMHFIYEIDEFINIIKSNDNRKYSSLKTKTLQIMEILTTCRYESGLIFDKDLV